MRVITNVNN